MFSPYQRRALRDRALLASLLLVTASLQMSCGTARAPAPHALPKHESRTDIAALQQFYEELRTARVQFNEGDQQEKTAALLRNVRIEGQDILLPQSTDQLGGDTTYSFYVFAHDPKGRRTIDQLLQSGELRIEVIGAEPDLSFPKMQANAPDRGDDVLKRTVVVNANGSVAKITIKQTKEKPLQPFTILAWFPGQFAAGAARDGNTEKWSARRDVKVFYGDVRTRVQIVSQNEAAALFGKTFAQNYYVGRVFLRNRNTDKALAVYTTSMRVPVLLYRRTELGGGLNPSTAVRLDRLAREKFRELGGVPGKLTEEAAAEVVKPLLNEANTAKVAPTPHTRGSTVTTTTTPQPLDKNELVQRVVAVWANLLSQSKPDPSKLTADEIDELVERALALTVPDVEPDPHAKPGAATRESILTAVVGPDSKESKSETHLRRQRATRLVEATHRALAEAKASALKSANDLTFAFGATVQPLLVMPPPAAEQTTTAQPDTKTAAPAPAAPALEQPDLRRKIATSANKLVAIVTQAPQTPTSPSAIAAIDRELRPLLDQLTGEPLRRDLQKRLDDAIALTVRIVEERAVADAFSGKGVLPELRAYVELQRDRVGQAVRRTEGGTPFNETPTIPVNPNRASLAYSDDPLRQKRLLEHGYIWRESFRPMTFQAVLAAVMASHENDPSTRRIVILETLAKIAGGAVGMSGVVEEFGRTGYLQATNFFSSVFTPSLRGLLVEDLKRFITNLGETGMDTVVIIPPNESQDRFVFFPRGAIYNFPDEFDAASPAYIAGIEGEDVFVEAITVNSNEVLLGGTVGASTLVARALNEGEKSNQARLFDIAQTQARLRTAELGNLLTQIDAIIAAAPADKPGARAAAEAEVQRRVTHFVSYFGPDQSGTLGAALAKHGISAHNTAPTVAQILGITLPVGATSRAFPLNIFDVETPLKDLKVTEQLTDDDKKWVETAPATPSASGITVVVTSKPAADFKEPLQRTITYQVKDSGDAVVPFKLQVVQTPWKPEQKLVDSVTKVATSPPEKQLKRQLYQLIVRVPLYDADASKLKLEVKSATFSWKDKDKKDKSEDAKAIGTLTQSLNAAPPEIVGTFNFDTSKLSVPPDDATDVALTFTFALKKDTTELHTFEFKAAVANPEKK